MLRVYEFGCELGRTDDMFQLSHNVELKRVARFYRYFLYDRTRLTLSFVLFHV